jgi:arginine utilization regulatory protein
VRELEHIIEAAMNIIMNEEGIKYSHLPFHDRNKLQHVLKKINAMFHEQLSSWLKRQSLQYRNKN